MVMHVEVQQLLFVGKILHLPPEKDSIIHVQRTAVFYCTFKQCLSSAALPIGKGGDGILLAPSGYRQYASPCGVI